MHMKMGGVHSLEERNEIEANMGIVQPRKLKRTRTDCLTPRTVARYNQRRCISSREKEGRRIRYS